MPIVRPDIENRVQLRPVTDAKVRAADFGQDQYGRSIAQAGAQLGDIAERQERINAVYDEAAAKRVDNEAMLRLGELRRGAMAAKGEQAQSARLQYEEAALKTKDELLGKLSNDRQRFLFTSAYDNRYSADLDRIATHADTEVRTFAVNEGTARATNFRDRAVDMIDDPVEFEISLNTGISEVEAVARLQGMGPADTSLAVAKYKSSVYTASAEAIDDVLLKEDFINTNAANILPEDETKLRQKIKPALEEARTDAAEGMVLEAVGLVMSRANEEVQTGEPGDQPDDAPIPEKQKQVAAAQAHPLRGKGRVSDGFNAARDGGTRQHGSIDYAAPEGTPVHPPSEGTVVFAGPKGGYGNYIRIRHADGRETGYGHLRNINVKKGDTVSAADVIGGVGNTGKSSGPHLHYETFNEKGNRVDPEKQSWAQGQLPTYKADRVDKQVYYEEARKVATELNMSVPEFNALLRRMDAHVNRQDDLVQREEQEQARIAEEAIAQIENAGGELDSIAQVPNFSDLPARLQSSILNQIKQNRREAAKVEPYGEVFLALDEMAGRADGQAAFLTVNIDEYADRLTKAERGRLKGMQAKIRNGGGAESAVASDFSRINTFIVRAAPAAGIETGTSGKATAKENRERRAKLFGLIEAEVAQEQKDKNRKLTDPELQAIVNKNVAPVLVKEAGFFGQREVEKPLFEVRGVPGARARPTIPAKAQQDIIKAYKQQYGRTPSVEQQLDIYYRSIGQ